MQLQDYLHYYIGCKVEKDSDALDYPTIKGIHGDRVMISEYRYKTPHCDGVFARPEMYQYIGFIKPILRRLEDMTEEEAIKVHREATKTPFLPADKDEYDVTYIKDKGDICSIQVVDLRMPKMYTNINVEGDVLVYIHEQNEEPKICERVANQHHITHYLLRQGFDLFGLISAGLAIDAKTLNP